MVQRMIGPILCMSVLACAPAKDKPPQTGALTFGETVDTVCFTSGLAGFSQSGDDLLVLRRSPGESYAVTLGFCPNLKSAEGLKITDPGQCLHRGSRLLVYDTPLPLKNAASDRPDRCLVTQIRKVVAPN